MDHDTPRTTTNRQLAFLNRHGFDTTLPWTRSSAHEVIRRFIDGRRDLPATEKQQMLLKRRGLWRDGMSRGEAFDLIDQVVSAARWYGTS